MRWLKDFGGWVAIAGLLAAGLIGWGQATTKIEDVRGRMDKVEPDVQQSKTDQAVVRQRLDDFGKALDRIEDKLGTKR